MLVYLTINGIKDSTMPEKVSDEFAELIEAYNFKDFEEVNMVLQWEDRCRNRNLFNWCPKDSEELKKYLTQRR